MSVVLRSLAELILNGGFETAGSGGGDIFANWTETPGDGAIADETSIKYADVHAARLTAGVSSNTVLTQTVTVIADAQYQVSFYTRGDGTHDGKYSLYDVTNSAFIVSTVDTGITAATWTLVTLNVNTPVGCVSMRLTLGCPVENGGIAYYDAISILRLYTLPDPITCPFDGAPTGVFHTMLDNSIDYRSLSASVAKRIWRPTWDGLTAAQQSTIYAAWQAVIVANMIWIGPDGMAYTVRALPENARFDYSHNYPTLFTAALGLQEIV